MLLYHDFISELVHVKHQFHDVFPDLAGEHARELASRLQTRVYILSQRAKRHTQACEMNKSSYASFRYLSKYTDFLAVINVEKGHEGTWKRGGL